jgi:nucleoside-diphosphate-sugar epimerase
LPSNQSPLGALPARFRRQRLLVVGCGDVGLRVLRALPKPVRVLALTSTASRQHELRSAGAVPLIGNLDDARSLRRLAGLAQRVLHLAPPPGDSKSDPRTLSLMHALRLRSAPGAVVYGSTSGVYGNHHGAVVTEASPLNAASARALRRVDAENNLRAWGRSSLAAQFVRVSILRIPGIYAPNREGGTPQTRLLKGTPVLHAAEDVYTNHIHADDLARACIAALWRGKPQRTFNVNDDTRLKMGDYFDLAAGIYGLSRPPRISRAQAQIQLPPMQLSFMAESRQMDNTRMKRELRLRLRYPSVVQGLR